MGPASRWTRRMVPRWAHADRRGRWLAPSTSCDAFAGSATARVIPVAAMAMLGTFIARKSSTARIALGAAGLGALLLAIL